MQALTAKQCVRVQAFKAVRTPCTVAPRVVVSLPQQSRQQQRLASRKQSSLHAAEGGATPAPSYDLDDIDTAKAAIDLGLGLCSEKRWGEALAVFEKALTLPGTGLKRYRDKPRMISDGEKQAAMYNIACCHAQLNDARSGLVALSGCFEAGYEDFQQVRSDPDFINLRSDPRFDELLRKYEPQKRQGGGLFGLFK